MENNKIPYEEKEIREDLTISRFASAPWIEVAKKSTITLAGLGGIGSYVCFLLCRSAIGGLTIYDNDIVEEGNLSGQFYGWNAINKPKVIAAFDMCKEYSNPPTIIARNCKYTKESVPDKIMISGFDNMEARKIFFNKWKQFVYELPEEQRKECLFIDGRLSAEDLQIFCITGDDSFHIEDYENKKLFSDEESESTICSYKQTSYMANMIGSLINNLFINHCSNLSGSYRELPYYTEYLGETMMLETLN